MNVCDKVDQMIKMYVDDKMTSVEIAYSLGCCSSTVQRHLKRAGIELYHTPNEIRLSDEEIEIIKARYENGDTAYEISKDYGLCEGSIRSVLRKNGVVIRDAKRRSIISCHDYFKTIDSVDKAYFLGWMISDGSVVQQHRGGRSDVVSLEIHKDDEYILEMFASAVGARKESVKTFQKRDHSYFRFASSEMSKDLAKYGVVPRKSWITFLPDIREDMMPHLIRGIFDGDGTITIDKSNNAHIAFYGSERLCNDISLYLHEHINVNLNKVSKTTCCHVWWGGKSPAKAIGNYLYANCGKYYLERKFNRFIKYM